jgi:transcriptional regulator with XRE-family HTH domain
MSMKKPRPTTEGDRFLGRRIREARIASGMSQGQLGDLLGVSYQQVQKYEQGKNRVNGGRIEGLVTALNRPIHYFFPNVTDVRPAPNPALLSKEGFELATNFARITSPKARGVLLTLSALFVQQEQENG